MAPFLTAYDPLGGSTGSIDPLGALQTYGAMAEMVLPGITTVTNRSRYLSVLCAALSLAEQHRRFPQGAAGASSRRRAVEPFERLWAVACVVARSSGIDRAADGLRGVTYAEDYFRDIRDGGKRVTPGFRLLKYQARAGAVGTYWTALNGGMLAEADTGTLTAEGRELGGEFPEPPVGKLDRERLTDPEKARHVSMTFDELQRWAQECHLAAAKRAERRLLGEALVADDRWGCIAQALVSLDQNDSLPALWDIPAMKKLRATLACNPRAVSLGLPETLDAIARLERFHEAALAVFESLLWWGTECSERSVEEMFGEHQFELWVDRLRQTAHEVLQFRIKCERPDLRQALDRLVPFAQSMERGGTPRDVVDEMLRWHQRVQLGKVDGGAPKREWVALNGTATRLARPSPRFQRMARPAPPTGRRLTHPYRLEQFIYMLRENDVLPRAREAVA